MKPTGLTTREAFQRLYNDIANELQKFEEQQVKQECNWLTPGTWKHDAYHHNSPYSTLRWTSGLMLLLEAIFLFVCYGATDDPRCDRLVVEALVVLIILLVNLFTVGWDSRMRHHEIQDRVQLVLKYIKECTDVCCWEPRNYPQLNMPFSPCITLQWTYRDGHLVNLHWSLLVQGDIVALRPGQQVPGHCKPLENQPGQGELHFGEQYVPPSGLHSKSFSGPRARQPLTTQNFVLQETPYIKNLRLALTNARHRPMSIFDKERFLVSAYWIEKMLVPLVLIIMLFINVLRYIYLSPSVGHWSEMLILLQVQAVLPLLPLIFPILWLLLNVYGMARLQTIFQISKSIKLELDPFDEFGEILPSIPGCLLTWNSLQTQCCDVLLGRSNFPSRTANLLHVLGSVTALCCVDKKGILSWPNPTAEKVFFLRTADINLDSSKGDSVFQSAGSLAKEKTSGLSEEHSTPRLPSDRRMSEKFKSKHFKCDTYTPESVVEVLDLTHDNQVPFGLQFDDPKWKSYINSLKPLGLAILLNTCNPATQDHYTQFSSHITYEALHNEDVVPVVNRRHSSDAHMSRVEGKAHNTHRREVGLSTDFPNSHSRCLCELARQIGFTEQAMDIFQLQEQLSTFRPVQPDLVRKDKFARSLSVTKLKFPFPHMVSVIMKESNTGMLQLMSQGTGDIILDSCSEFWDGRDLCSLVETDRKKILDFYHRTSLTAYCTAFAYRPLTANISHKFNNMYLELPADSSSLYPSVRSPTPTTSWDLQSLDSRMKHLLTQYFSTESLLGQGDDDSPESMDVETCFQTQCNQVFIGMVTMQYQARTDIVHLIEQLDKACIRFVHFSKENELRSRVFSEKMGLESGWNCHISLLSERNRRDSGNSSTHQTNPGGVMPTYSSKTMSPLNQFHLGSDGLVPFTKKIQCTLNGNRQLSRSAPGAINLEMAVVKFEDEISTYDISAIDASSITSDARGRQCSPQAGKQEVSPEQYSDLDSSSNEVDLEEPMLRKNFDGIDEAHASRSPSHVTESTEHSAPVGFDMSNRAKLPKGIENIRPHLDNIDNVPLLVSLFTDCIPEATCEMIKIMQEYGEVVCCMGSAANCHNMSIFLQADASIAVEPLYPQLCMKQPVFIAPPKFNGPSVMEISHQLNSLTSSLSFYREDPVSIYHLIMEARHYTGCMRNCFHFLVACCVSLSFLQILASAVLLPPILTSSHLLWLTCIIIPLLSVTLISTPVAPQIMILATGKNNNHVDKAVVVYIGALTAIKFIPSLVICLLCFGMALLGYCSDLTQNTDQCHVLFGHQNFTIPHEWNGWGSRYVATLYSCQNMVAFLLVLYFVCISASFVHKHEQLWKKSPFQNRPWCCVVVFVLILQVIYGASDIVIHEHSSLPSPGLSELPLHVWFIAFFWPFGLILFNETVKMHEIRANVRYQKRARLEFGTKLGMNSPF